MKYEIISRGPRLEAIGAHGGHRIRITTLSARDLESWPVKVCVRGSESEDEVEVDVPKRHLGSAGDALEHGYACAVMWIDALDRRLHDET